MKFSFNPTEYTITAASSWKQTPAKGKEGPTSEFTGTLPQTLSMDALFVNDPARGDDVVSATFYLREMTKPSTASVSKEKPSAPVLLFKWGKNIEFYECHLKSVTIKYTLFDEKGDATRATASIVLERVQAETPKQNPTLRRPVR